MSGTKPVVRPSRNMDDHPACCVLCRHVIRDDEPRVRVSRPATGPAHEGCARKAAESHAGATDGASAGTDKGEGGSEP